jgi:hypothetical protein
MRPTLHIFDLIRGSQTWYITLRFFPTLYPQATPELLFLYIAQNTMPRWANIWLYV